MGGEDGKLSPAVNNTYSDGKRIQLTTDVGHTSMDSCAIITIIITTVLLFKINSII
jgi:hypothetical protein